MPSVVSDKCKKCLSCVEVCPVEAFRVNDAAPQVVVDPDVCIDCGVCISECPAGAITSDGEAQEKDIAYNAENSKKWA